MRLRSLAATCLLLCAALAQAHDARPNFVEIIETETNVFSVQWKIPATVPNAALPTIRMPESCTTDARLAMQQSGGAYQGRLVYNCPDGLSGHEVRIEFPVINPSLSSLFQVRLANGEQYVKILKPEESSWTVPDAENKLAVAGQYTLLGIEHIWIGIDHLLFVTCLLLIARTARKVLITITGFTVAHSITLFLSALDVIRIPTPPVEAAIALSVVFLAWEIVKNDETQLTFPLPGRGIDVVRPPARFRVRRRPARHRPAADPAADGAAVLQHRCRDRPDPVRSCAGRSIPAGTPRAQEGARERRPRRALELDHDAGQLRDRRDRELLADRSHLGILGIGMSGRRRGRCRRIMQKIEWNPRYTPEAA